MFIPSLKVGTFVLAKLYHDHVPSKVRIDGISDESPNLVNITIFNKDGSEYDQREIDLENNDNGFEFFTDAPLDSKYYYRIIEHEQNSYDAIDVHERDTFMCPDKAIEAANALEAKKGEEHVVTVCLF